MLSRRDQKQHSYMGCLTCVVQQLLSLLADTSHTTFPSTLGLVPCNSSLEGKRLLSMSLHSDSRCCTKCRVQGSTSLDCATIVL